MIALTQAIFAAFSSNGTLTAAFPGGMWRDRAKEDAAMPYIVSLIPPASTVTSYGNKHRDDVLVTFVAHGVGHDATGAALETFDAAFNDTTLTLSSGANYDCRRTQPPTPLMKEGVDGSGNEVWAWSVQYVYSVRN